MDKAKFEMTCVQCGHTNDPGKMLCFSCGVILGKPVDGSRRVATDAMAAAAKDGGVICSACSYKNAPRSANCALCGELF